MLHILFLNIVVYIIHIGIYTLYFIPVKLLAV